MQIIDTVLAQITENQGAGSSVFLAQALCRRGIKFHTKQSSNPVCTVLNDTHPEIKIHTNSYYKI